MERDISAYFSALARLGAQTEATDKAARTLGLAAAFAWVQRTAQTAHDSGHKLMFVGNGGSAGIASHCAIDYSKNGNLRALAFNDGAALTCLGNDLGYENVFAKQVEMHGRSGDFLIAISSSGNSPNIHRAVSAARGLGCAVATFSGFRADNPLRVMGDVNFYVGSDVYGFVEILHLTLCHAMLDLAMGWRAPEPSVEKSDLKAESLV